MKTGAVLLFEAGRAGVHKKFMENGGLTQVNFRTVKHFGSGALVCCLMNEGECTCNQFYHIFCCMLKIYALLCLKKISGTWFRSTDL